MKLTINLATRRYLNLGQLNGILLFSGALLLALGLFKAGEVGHNRAELARITGLSQGTGTKGQGVQVSNAQLKNQAARVRFANEAIDRKSMNWLNLLDRLEEVVPAGVALTEIGPDRAQVLKVVGVARGFANLRTLLENMEHSKNFSEVYLLSQSESKVGLTQEGLRFSISCKVPLR